MNTLSRSIPAIFHGAKEYRDLPEALELAQRTFNEEAMYQRISAFARAWYRRKKRKARILDLCSATGWAALRVATTISPEFVTLVDLDGGALEKAQENFRGVSPVNVVLEDAVAYEDSQFYDLILMNSAYHHIEDDRKVAFLKRGAKHLAQDGIIVVGEHFLPAYGNEQEHNAAVVRFYSALIASLERRREPEAAIDVIRRSGLYCWERQYEYKVSFNRFKRDVLNAGLCVGEYERIWPETEAQSLPKTSGSFVLGLHQPR